MLTYPIMLNVRGRPCVVVGAGRVALRRAASLLAGGAKVRLIGPDAPERSAGRPEPDTEAVPEGVEVVRRPYEKRLLAGAFLVFACTDDRRVNARIAADARSVGALVNAADQPADCDFFCPAVAKFGEVVLAVGTGGACPALAKALRDRAAERLPQRVGEFAEALREARRRVRGLTGDRRTRERLIARLAGPEGYNAFMRDGPKGLLALAQAELQKEQ